MRTCLLLFVVATMAMSEDPAGDTAREIVRKSSLLDDHNFQIARDYTFQEHIVERLLDARGHAKSTGAKTYDITFLFGIPYRRLLAINDQPLSAAKARKEEEKLSRTFAEREKESEGFKQKRLDKYLKERERGRAFLREVPDAFDFRLAGVESIQGHEAYVIEATPRPGYRPRDRDADILQKVQGKVWIDKAELQWIKCEAETIDTFSIGLFIARLDPGSHLLFEQAKVNGQVWLPHHIAFRGSGRLALVKKIRAGGEILYSHYKKLRTDSNITTSDDVSGLVSESPEQMREPVTPK